MRVQSQQIYHFLTLNILLVQKKLSDLGGERDLFVMERVNGFEDRKTRVQTLTLPLRATVTKDGDQKWRK